MYVWARAGEITLGQTTDDAGVVDQDYLGVSCDDRESVAEASHRPACRTRPGGVKGMELRTVGGFDIKVMDGRLISRCCGMGCCATTERTLDKQQIGRARWRNLFRQ